MSLEHARSHSLNLHWKDYVPGMHKSRTCRKLLNLENCLLHQSSLFCVLAELEDGGVIKKSQEYCARYT